MVLQMLVRKTFSFHSLQISALTMSMKYHFLFQIRVATTHWLDPLLTYQYAQHCIYPLPCLYCQNRCKTTCVDIYSLPSGFLDTLAD